MVHRRVAALGMATAIVAAATHACSSFDASESTSAPADAAAADGTASSSAPDGRAPGCLTAPADPAGEAEFCAFEQRYFERCGQCEECRQRNLNDCSAFGAGASRGFKKVLVACAERLKCVEFKDLAGDPCFEEHLPTLELSQKQLEVKAAYCAACPDRVDECATFYARGPDGGGALAGSIVAIMNDELAEEVRKGCANQFYCDPGLFGLCSYGKLCDYYKGKDNCDKSLCK